MYSDFAVNLWIYNYILKKDTIQDGDANMEKFSPKKAEQVVTTIRIPRDLLDCIDKCSSDADISRNEFINQCILYAINNMEEKVIPE